MQSIEEPMDDTNRDSYLCVISMLLLFVLVGFALGQGPTVAKPHVETVVVIRHGEKPHGGLGQLSCQGLNRALALPKILTDKYGKPDFIFAPNPLPTMKEGENRYSYVRPLATIEPTAIQHALPVNATIGFNDVKALVKEVSSPQYADSVVFVSWEHIMAQHFAENMIATFGGDIRQVPEWPGDDFDSIYVLRITRNADKATITFTHDQEGLDHKLSKACPSVPQS